MMIPEWLPLELDLSSNSYEADIKKLFAVYEHDFLKTTPPIVDGLPVYTNSHPDPSWGGFYPQGFTHIITCGKKLRKIDYDRATRLPWVRAVLENYKEPEVRAFWDKHPKGDTLYLWLADIDFVVILRRMRSKTRPVAGIMVTAYTLNRSYCKKDMQRRYNRSYKRL